MTIVATVKACSKCKAVKRVGEFNARKSRAGGLMSACKVCISAYNAARYAANPQAAIDRARSWQEANKERARDNVSRYQRENKQQRVLIRHRQRTQLRASPKISLAQIKARVDYFGGKCWMCGDPYEVLDHVKPLSKGGPNILSNIRPACAPCNGSKWSHWYGPRELTRFTKI